MQARSARLGLRSQDARVPTVRRAPGWFQRRAPAGVWRASQRRAFTARGTRVGFVAEPIGFVAETPAFNSG
eukprot:scaffold99841_cov54-Phaeocystis_antarctica.AAC.4